MLGNGSSRSGSGFWDGRQSQQRLELGHRLIAAIKRRDRKAALALLAQGADPNARDEFAGCSALLLAVEGVPGTGPAPEDTLLVRALLDKGADVNARDAGGGTALMSAAVLGYLRTARLLLDRFAVVNLRDKGCDITVGDLGMVGTVHIGPRSALQYAQEFGNIEVMRLLLARGADVNVRDHYGMTLLMDAASGSGGYTTTMRLLLAHGADVNARDKDGRTALMLAANSAMREAIVLLHEHRAEINARDVDGKTPLIYSMEGPGDNPKTLAMLLSMGADYSITSRAGETALSIAERRDYGQSVRILLQAGARQ